MQGQERGLRYFLSFLKQKGSTRITTALALQFAIQRRQTHPAEYAKRLSIVRGFARYHRGIDPSTEVPPFGLLPRRQQRRNPYLYSEDEIGQLLKAAQRLRSKNGLKPWTYHCLLGLLAVTGMRLGEAVNLRFQDVDCAQGLLTICNTKFGKSRLIPLHATTQKVLARYIQRRKRLFSGGLADQVFVSDRGVPLRLSTVEETFDELLRQVGLPAPSVEHNRNGEDVGRRLPVLSTYLGHAQVTHTYWYVTNTPELMKAAGNRVEKRWRPVDEIRA
jgi:integrase